MVAAQQHRRAPYPYPEKRMDDDDKRLRRGVFAFLRRSDATVVGFAVVGVLLLVLSLHGVYELLLQDDDTSDGGQASATIEDEISQQSNLTEINDSVQADLEARVRDHISQLSSQGLQSDASKVKGKTKYEEMILDNIYNAMQKPASVASKRKKNAKFDQLHEQIKEHIVQQVEGTQVEVGATDSDSSGAGAAATDSESSTSSVPDEGIDAASFDDQTDYAQLTGDVRRIQVAKYKGEMVCGGAGLPLL
eukprot:CAMPEP_0118921978 /NCGR_PEP_ID=MMETSP1169-20130426/1077_1 /TAXON_ID=36882 /ORGANISM="Pyramimonas obovata, Strain CCMP722" /LENGTH=248 /DNA_ID=CAMNT_0006862785 /DNA_START=313 /DNA_END=1055 /DNA_ORIENTATION=+